MSKAWKEKECQIRREIYYPLLLFWLPIEWGVAPSHPALWVAPLSTNIGQILQDQSQLWDFETCWQEDSAGILPSSSSLPSRTESFAAKWVGRVQKSLSPNSLPRQHRGQPHVRWGCHHLSYFLETIPSEGSSPSDKALWHIWVIFRLFSLPFLLIT